VDAEGIFVLYTLFIHLKREYAMMNLRSAQLSDLPAIMRLIDAAVSAMLAAGKHQWDRTYPATEHILADIAARVAYVMEDGGGLLAYCAIDFRGEPAYPRIEGEWLTPADEPYVVVHRLAVDPALQGRGVGSQVLRAVERLAAGQGVGSFKVDTNYDNYVMLHLMEKLGFAYCGKIHYERGERLGYEKLI
jgi:GNAT superfamily N-acetyltransferase